MHVKSTIFLTALCLLIFASGGTASPARQEREDNSSPEPPPFDLPSVSIYKPFDIEKVRVKTYFAPFSGENVNAALVLEHDLTDNRFQLSVKDDPIVQGSRVRGTAGRGWKVKGDAYTGDTPGYGFTSFSYDCTDPSYCRSYVEVEPKSQFVRTVVAQKNFAGYATVSVVKGPKASDMVTAQFKKLDDADNAPSSGAVGP